MCRLQQLIHIQVMQLNRQRDGESAIFQKDKNLLPSLISRFFDNIPSVGHDTLPADGRIDGADIPLG